MQYFACQKFSKNGSERQISGTEKQGLLLSVFISRTSKDKRKHHDGMCQRDFVSKHKSHDKYPIINMC